MNLVVHDVELVELLDALEILDIYSAVVSRGLDHLEAKPVDGERVARGANMTELDHTVAILARVEERSDVGQLMFLRDILLHDDAPAV